ncbi:hypothetical protein EDF68_1198 [Ochrobactrum sp. BH3]|nr:hypothetical protein EDF68_1198 [Ochrobactrum sp. BH3]
MNNLKTMGLTETNNMAAQLGNSLTWKTVTVIVHGTGFGHIPLSPLKFRLRLR